MGLINSPKCVYCENEDSILHYLFRCENVNNSIELIVDYINSYIEHEITYCENEYIFGVRDKALNHMFMIIKYTIWLLKNLGNSLNINTFRFQLYKRMKAEEC